MLSSGVVFPSGGGLQGIVHGLLSSLYNGVGSYAVAIFLFVIIIRLVVMPVEFGAKYFQKKHTMKMAELKPEMDALAVQHAGDPVGMNRARSQLMKKSGASMGGFCLFSLINIAVMLTVFITVFQGLVAVGNFNVNEQFYHLRNEYHAYIEEHLEDRHGGDMEALLESETFSQRMNEVHRETTTSFLWISNFWRPDTPWTGPTINWSGFRGATQNINGGVISEEIGDAEGQERLDILYELQNEYNNIFGVIETRGANGFLLLVLFAGASTFLSVWINSKIMGKNKKPEEKKVVEEVGYSMRNAKSQQFNPDQKPAIDPQRMGKMMKIIMPVVMVVFAMTMTGALALYITLSSLVTTGFAFLMNLGIMQIIKLENKRKDKKATETEGEPDMTIINPHAKYFKRKKKST